MRTPTLALVPLLVALGCSSGKAPVHPDAGAGDGGVVAPLSYAPTGCAYTITPPTSWAYLAMALDDTTAVDAATATPIRVRLGLGGNTAFGKAGYPDPATSAVFTWETAGANHAAKVRLGTSATSMGDVHTGSVWTTPSPAHAVGSSEPPTYMHEVHVCGLQPATTYYYQVGGGPAGKEVWSATQNFTTVAATGPVTVGIAGDSRDVVTTWQIVHQRLLAAKVSAILFSGDVVDIGTDEELYSTWLDAIWKDPNDPSKFLTLGQLMFLPIAGNHENEAVRFYSNFAIPGDGPYAKTFNSFNIGSAHVVMIDDTPLAAMLTDIANAELAWLATDLAAADADRQNHPFIIAISHRGLFSTSMHSTDPDVLSVRGALAPLFDKYHVDLVFNGHDHEYERSLPLTAGANPSGDPVVHTSPSQGTTYVICAGAGADPYQVGTAPSPYRKTNAQFGTGTMYIGTYGILSLNGTQLTFTAYGLRMSGPPDDPLDTVELSH